METIDAVEDYGWDPNGNELCDSPPVRDDLTFKIPEGTYKFSHEATCIPPKDDRDPNRGGTKIHSGIKNYHIEAAGPDKVEFVAAKGSGQSIIDPGRGWAYTWAFRKCRNVSIGGFTTNSTMDRGTANMMYKLEGDEVELHDIHFKGYQVPGNRADNGAQDVPNDAIRVDKQLTHVECPEDSSHNGYIRRIRKTGPAHMDGHGGREGFLILDYRHEGTLHVEDIYAENMNGDTMFYTTDYGTAHFRRIHGVNPSMGGLRLGGESTLKNAVFEFDPDKWHDENTGYINAPHGFYMASQSKVNAGDHDERYTPAPPGPFVENVDVIVKDGPMIHGAPAVRINEGVGGGSAKDLRIRYEGNHDNAIIIHGAKQRFGKYYPEKNTYSFKNLSVTGGASVESVIENRADDQKKSVDVSGCINMPNASSLTSGSAADAVDLNVSDDNCTVAKSRQVARPPGDLSEPAPEEPSEASTASAGDGSFWLALGLVGAKYYRQKYQ